MNNIKYTIRSIPKPVDAFLRKKAHQTGASLNRTVVDILKTIVEKDKKQNDNDFSWFTGSHTIDDVSLEAIKDMKEYDKQKQERDEDGHGTHFRY